MQTIQASARFLSHMLLAYPGQSPTYSYAWDVASAPWMDMDSDQDTPPAHLSDIRAAEQAQAQPLTIQNGSQSVTLTPYIRAVLVYPDPAGGQMLGRMDLLYLDDQGNCMMEHPYVRALTPSELAQHTTHEDTLRQSIPLDLNQGLQRAQERRAMMAASTDGQVRRVVHPKTGQPTGYVRVRNGVPAQNLPTLQNR